MKPRIDLAWLQAVEEGLERANAPVRAKTLEQLVKDFSEARQDGRLSSPAECERRYLEIISKYSPPSSQSGLGRP